LQAAPPCYEYFFHASAQSAKAEQFAELLLGKEVMLSLTVLPAGHGLIVIIA